MNRLFLNVGYELTEAQLRTSFSRFGTVSDVYLPKHTSGKNKGYGFATFVTEEALLLALQTPQHVVEGVLVQVKRAGPRPVDSEKDMDVVGVASSHVFGRGPRLYVGGVADAVSEERVRQHFGKWGSVTDVYFPGVKGQKRPNYCFVTFDNYRNSQRACDQSDRQIDGWPIESITIAEDRKGDIASPANDTQSMSNGVEDMPVSSPIAAAQQLAQLSNAAAGIPGYALWLQLQYQSALAKMPTVDPSLAPFPLDASTMDTVPQPSPSMHSDLSTAYLQNSSMTDMHWFTPNTAQASMTMPGWGGLPSLPVGAGQLPGFAPHMQSHMYDQSLMASRAPGSVAQHVNSLAFAQAPMPGLADQGLSPAWAMNYGVPPAQYPGVMPTDMYQTVAPLTGPGPYMPS